MKNWYLIHSKAGKEFLAAKNLERQDFHTYLPVMRSRSNEIKPMFPRYLFAELSTVEDNWLPIRSTVGVSNIVVFGDQPASASAQLIDDIKQFEELNKAQSCRRTLFEANDSVVIKSGNAFSGYEGQFLKYSSRDRVVVLLSVAERDIRLNLTEKDIRHTCH